MTRIRRSGWMMTMVWLLAVPGLAQAAELTAEQRALIAQVLTLSGAKEQVAAIPAQIPSQVEEHCRQRQPALPQEECNSVGRLMADAFREGALLDSVRTTMEQRFDETKLRAVLQQLQTPLFEKISRLEVQTSSEGVQPIRDYIASLQTQPPSQMRLELVRRLDTSTGATNWQLDLMVGMARSMINAMAMRAPSFKPPAPQQLEQQLLAMLSTLRDPLEEQFAFVSLYAYRSLSDGELDRYVAFYESELGRWFWRVIKDALHAAIMDAAARMGRMIVDELQ